MLLQSSLILNELHKSSIEVQFLIFTFHRLNLSIDGFSAYRTGIGPSEPGSYALLMEGMIALKLKTIRNNSGLLLGLFLLIAALTYGTLFDALNFM